jgi:hypothetical protein
MSDRDELKIIVLAHIRCFFWGTKLVFIIIAHKKRTLYHHVRTAKYSEKKKTLYQPKVVKKKIVPQ